MKTTLRVHAACMILGMASGISGLSSAWAETQVSLPTVHFVLTDTMQTRTYNNLGNVIAAPEPGEAFYGQDAQHQGLRPSYTDNGDGTVTDNHTGLMWQQTPPTDKMTYQQALEYVADLELGGYSDWRLPTIKESFSLANLDGHLDVKDISQAVPYIDTDYFDFTYDVHRPYTGSYWTSTVCKMPAQNDYEQQEKNYGFNWADGHMKSYGDGYHIDGTYTGASIPAGVRAVRGQEGIYGVNDFVDNQDGTITDQATGLMWTQRDSGAVNDDGSLRVADDVNYGLGRTWVDTLAWVEQMNQANYLGYSDWRLPDAKELQSIVQYEKTTLPAADTEFFKLTRPDCYVWTSSTCGDFPELALYIAFGKAYGINLFSGAGPAQAQHASEGARPMGPPPMGTMGPPPAEGKKPQPGQRQSVNTETITVADFVDVHGPGAIRADYKDTLGEVSQAPALSRQLWSKTNAQAYPYPYDPDNTTTEFDLGESENAADYIVIYNYALLVRDAE